MGADILNYTGNIAPHKLGPCTISNGKGLSLYFQGESFEFISSFSPYHACQGLLVNKHSGCLTVAVLYSRECILVYILRASPS